MGVTGHQIGKLLLKDLGKKVLCTVLAIFLYVCDYFKEVNGNNNIKKEEVKGIEERVEDVKEDMEEIDKV